MAKIVFWSKFRMFGMISLLPTEIPLNTQIWTYLFPNLDEIQNLTDGFSEIADD